MKFEYTILVYSIILGLGFWFIDAALGAVFSYERSFWQLLVADVPSQDVYARLVVIACFAVFGTVGAIAVPQRMRAEVRMWKSEAQFRHVIDRNADGIVVINKDGVVRFANPAAELLFGHKSEDIMGNQFGYPIVAGETAELDIVRQTKGPATAEMRVVKIDWKGEPAFLASLHDITERRRTEWQLVIAETAIRTCTSAIATTDLNGRITYVNPAFLKLWGYDNQDEVLDRSIADLCQESQVRGLIEVVLTRKSVTAELAARRKDGTEFILGLRASLISDADGEASGITFSMAYITQKKPVEETVPHSTAHQPEATAGRRRQVEK